MWDQVYNPLNNAALSTIAAAIPVVTLLVLIASGKVKAHISAIIAVIVTNLIAIFIFTMPAGMSIRASLLGIVAAAGAARLESATTTPRRFAAANDGAGASGLATHEGPPARIGLPICSRFCGSFQNDGTTATSFAGPSRPTLQTADVAPHKRVLSTTCPGKSPEMKRNL